MPPIVARIRLLTVYVTLLLPFICYGAFRALESSNNSPIDWVDSSFPERQHYDEFVKLFGPGDVVIASWPGCEWDDPRLDTLVKGLRDSRVFRGADGSPLFHQVVSGREVLLQLTGRHQTGTDAGTLSDAASALASSSPPAISPDFSAQAGPDVAAAYEAVPSIPEQRDLPLDLAIERLIGTLMGQDGKTTCLVLTFNAAGLSTRGVVVDNLRKAIRLTCEVNDEDIHLAGPVNDGFSVDQSSHRSLTNFAGPSALLIFGICWWSLGSIRLGAVVFLTAVFCQAGLLAAIFYTEQRLSALLIILPPLVQVLTVSGGIHLMNYYLTALETLSPREAATDAFRKGWLPTVLSLGTTAIGTASLMVSRLEPIRLFGIYATVGVLLTSASVLTVIPCTLILMSRGRARRNPGNASPAPVREDYGAHSTEILPNMSSGGWIRLASFLHRRNFAAVTLLLGIMLTGAAGLSGLQTSIRIETLFAPDSRIMNDYRWLEKEIGPLVPIEVLITFNDESGLNDRLRMDLLWRLNDALLKHPNVRSTSSALTIFPPMPSMKSLPGSMRYAVVNKAISVAKPAFERMAVLRESENGEVWRLTAHVSSLEALNYGEILEDIRTIISREMKARKDPTQGVSAATSGIMPLVHKIQGQLLSDLFSSLMSALLVITLTMTIVQAGVLSGLLAMLSNIFPIVIAFGWMGWRARPMDIGSVMTASVALGIAVDDTLHYLVFFRRMVSVPGATRFTAVVSAYQHCGRAMIQTSLSCGLGLLIFAFSDFVPTSRFAILMAWLLLLALLGDLLLLPAVLLSPAGKLFESSSEKDLAAGSVGDVDLSSASAETKEKAAE